MVLYFWSEVIRKQRQTEWFSVSRYQDTVRPTISGGLSA